MCLVAINLYGYGRMVTGDANAAGGVIVKMAKNVLCCGCGKLPGADEVELRTRSKRIDDEIKVEKKRRSRQVRLLLLGAGESGKSTFLKQMRIINQVHFDAREISEFRKTIYLNVTTGLQALEAGRQKLCIPFNDPRLEREAEKLTLFDSFSLMGSHNFFDFYDLFSDLWADGALRETFRRRAELQVTDATGYFLDNLQRICQPSFVPNRQDILYARKVTREISQFPICIDGVEFVFMDAGGQRRERRKWYDMLSSDLTSVLFMASVSEFDQPLYEDANVNRLEESLFIFEAMVNNVCFLDVPFVLFLNKMDLLEEKVKVSSIALHFEDFNLTDTIESVRKVVPEFGADPANAEDVKHFILHQFLSRVKQGEMRSKRIKPVYHHFTTATDTNNIRRVFNSVKDTVLRSNLNALMLY